MDLLPPAVDRQGYKTAAVATWMIFPARRMASLGMCSSTIARNTRLCPPKRPRSCYRQCFDLEEGRFLLIVTLFLGSIVGF